MNYGGPYVSWILARTKEGTDSQVTATKATTIIPILREDTNPDTMVTVTTVITIITITTIRKEEVAEIVALVWEQYVAYAVCLIVVCDRINISNYRILIFYLN